MPQNKSTFFMIFALLCLFPRFLHEHIYNFDEMERWIHNKCLKYHKATSSELALNFKVMICRTNLAPDEDESLVPFELPVFEHLLSLCMGTSVLCLPWGGFSWSSRCLPPSRFNDFISNGRNLLLIKKYITGFTTVDVLASNTATTVSLVGKCVTSPYAVHIDTIA